MDWISPLVGRLGGRSSCMPMALTSLRLLRPFLRLHAAHAVTLCTDHHMGRDQITPTATPVEWCPGLVVTVDCHLQVFPRALRVMRDCHEAGWST